ncbi:MAG TPA: hypothetical protein PLH39_03640 [Promineifilum sp.]|nr:hypothetical protein [Promineifilum sp.]
MAADSIADGPGQDKSLLPAIGPAGHAPGPSGYDRALGCRDGFLRTGCIILAIILILAALAGFAVI